MLLRDEVWREWSAREVASACAVSSKFVDNIKRELTANGTQFPERTKGHDGKVRKMPERAPSAEPSGTEDDEPPPSWPNVKPSPISRPQNDL